MISQYAPLNEIIKANIEDASDSQKIFSSKQINEILNGPYGNFIRLVLSACASFNKLISGLNLVQDTLLKTKRVNISEKVKLPKHLKNYPLTKITSLEKRLHELFNQDYKVWEKQLETWKQDLLTAFKDISFPLSEIEVREFQSKETISRVLNQFIEFKIELPKVTLNKLSIHDYLILKTYLAIHNSLFRRQCPSTTKDIMDILKKLSSTFSSIMKKEKEMLDAQKNEIDKLISPIRF
jgi:hypothetical protein